MNRRSIYRAALAASLLTAGYTTSPPVLAADAPEPGTDAKPAPAQPAAPSNTTIAQRTLRITWPSFGGGGDGVQPDPISILARLQDPKIGGAIGQQITGLPPAEVAKVLSDLPLNVQSRGGGAIEVNMSVDLNPKRFPNAKPAAAEFADALVEKFRSLLAEDQREREKPRLDQARQWMADVQVEFENANRRLLELQAEMGGRTPEGMRAALAKLDEERQRLELELAGLQARQRAVAEWIDRTSKTMQEQAKADPIVAELEKAVAAQERLVELTRQRFEAGAAPPSAVPEAEAKLYEARVQLLERKRGAAGAGAEGAAGDPVASLNRELQNLSIDVVDRKARLEFCEKRLDSLQKAAEAATKYELIESERTGLRRDFEQARQELQRAERAVQSSAPRERVTVIHSEQGRHEQAAVQAKDK